MKHLSISQLKLHKLSPLRWCRKYVDGMPEEITEALTFGKAVADSFEVILKRESKEVSDEIAFNLVHDWCSDNEDFLTSCSWDIEHSFSLNLADDLPPLIGAIDMLGWDNEFKFPHILDHKTCALNMKSNKFWGLKSNELANDWQLSLYAHYALNGQYDKHSRDAIARLTHNQFVKHKDGDLVVKYSNRRATALTSGFQLNKIVDEIKAECYNVVKTDRAYRQGGQEAVLSLYNTTVCDMCSKCRFSYGKKCPFINKCGA